MTKKQHSKVSRVGVSTLKGPLKGPLKRADSNYVLFVLRTSAKQICNNYRGYEVRRPANTVNTVLGVVGLGLSHVLLGRRLRN